MIIETLKKSVKDYQMVKFHKQAIDMQTANCMLTVYEGLNEKNKARFIKQADLNILKLIKFCWRCVE